MPRFASRPAIGALPFSPLWSSTLPAPATVLPTLVTTLPRSETTMLLVEPLTVLPVCETTPPTACSRLSAGAPRPVAPPTVCVALPSVATSGVIAVLACCVSCWTGPLESVAPSVVPAPSTVLADQADRARERRGDGVQRAERAAVAEAADRRADADHRAARIGHDIAETRYRGADRIAARAELAEAVAEPRAEVADDVASARDRRAEPLRDFAG
ncbi:MAG: hypothetical protein WDN30_16110 [Pararobbsia sp.]